MSGWRSRSGHEGGLLDDLITDPAPFLGATPARRYQSRVFLLIVAIIIAALAGISVHEASLRPPRRVLPPPIQANVLLVPIGPVPAEQLNQLPADYAAEYGLALTIAPAIELPATAYDPARRQFVAEDMIDALAASHADLGGRGSIVIGITQADLYIRAIDWNWAFALREGGRLAVISTARMPNTRYTNRWRLLRTMLTREVGFLCFGLTPTADRYDLLFRDILGVDDLRRLSEHL